MEGQEEVHILKESFNRGQGKETFVAFVFLLHPFLYPKKFSGLFLNILRFRGISKFSKFLKF